MSTRMRDSQRSKVYRAESVIISGAEERFRQVADIQSYVDRLVGSAWFRRRWPRVGKVEVRPGYGARRALATFNIIKLPLWSRSQAVILHELAHVCVNYTDGFEYPAHGREFCSTFLALVRHELGDEAWRSLKDSFRRNRVKHTRAPRTRPMTEEQKQAARERLVKARAAKAAKAWTGEDMDLTLREIAAVNRARCQRWHDAETERWTGADWSNALCGEVGEAANVVKKLRRHETGTSGPDDPDEETLRIRLGHELADVLLYLDLLADYYGVDLPSVVAEKFNLVSERQGFPERLPAHSGESEETR